MADLQRMASMIADMTGTVAVDCRNHIVMMTSHAGMPDEIAEHLRFTIAASTLALILVDQGKTLDEANEMLAGFLPGAMPAIAADRARQKAAQT